jgi:uncharacterized protein (TIGR02453 family)
MAFEKEFFVFMKQLKRNNTRAWFEKNRERYVAHVETPMLAFIREVGERLPGVAPAFLADPRRSGGSMFRIYRDTRFSADKSPYKTWVAARFQHRAATKDQPAPGFYIHLGPDEIGGGGGIYHVETPTLTRVRERIVSHAKDWSAVRKACPAIDGESLKRVPLGFDPSHPHADDLKRKDMFVWEEFTEREATSKKFVDRYVETVREAAPLMEFLTKALGLTW